MTGTSQRSGTKAAMATDEERLSADEPEPSGSANDRGDHRPFGRPGRPLQRASPFYIGFVGGLGVLLAYGIAKAVVDARGVLVLVVVSLFLAIGLNRVVDKLIRRGMRRPLAVAVVAVGVLVGFGGFVAALAQPLASQTTDLIAALPENLRALRDNQTIQRLDEQYDLLDRAATEVSSGGLGSSIFGGVVGFGKVLLGSAFGALTVLILTLYFLAALPRITRSAYLLVPRSRRERVRLLGDEIVERIGGYIGGAIAIAALAGVTSLIFLWIIGLPYALTLSLVVAVLALVPLVGATAGAAVVTLVALFDSTTEALACVVFYLIYQQVENYIIYPRVMSRSVDVPPTVTLVAALIGGTVLGIVGALLAIPTAAALLLIFREVTIPRQEQI